MRLARALILLSLWSGGVDAAQPLLWAPDGDYPGYPAAAPDDDVWHISADAGVTHDSNVFRLANGATTANGRAADIYNAGVGGDADLRVGRQHFLFDAQADDYRFGHFSFLNNLSYDAGAAWKWKVGRLWSGDLRYRHRRYLTSFANLHQPLKDMIDENHAYASVTQDLFYHLRLTAAADGYSYSHGAALRDVLNYQALSGILWLQYVSPSDNSIGLRGEVTGLRYPNQQVIASRLIDNRYHVERLSGTFDWQASGVSHFNGSVGYSRLRHHDISQRDFSGPTYLLQYRWTPLGSTVFRLSGFRDLRSYTDISANYILVQGYGAAASWAPTYRTVLQLDLAYENWHFRGDPGIAVFAGPQRHDTIRSGRVTAGYEPWRGLRLDAAYEYGKRTSNEAFSGYVYNQVEGELQLTF